ncbi:hypothetical protein OPT61_g362 [Boeremia exigua]|uniref:Uncharacterized protein n=1 Tax=Boeremia exigua TaxID=749465 RepID=A0ACC2IU32_9PLEO|nr:hypothetical protein OPT61_g362 [Boeremia exigua]
MIQKFRNSVGFELWLCLGDASLQYERSFDPGSLGASSPCCCKDKECANSALSGFTTVHVGIQSLALCSRSSGYKGAAGSLRNASLGVKGDIACLADVLGGGLTAVA